MKAGRKNLRRARNEGAVTLAEGESIMQVLALRGSNVIEVADAEGVKSLALFPAKFQKSFWIKKGNFVVVDASGRDEALESGSKIGCVVSQVLFHDQVRAMEKSKQWPAIFKSASKEGSEARTQKGTKPQMACKEGSEAGTQGTTPLIAWKEGSEAGTQEGTTPQIEEELDSDEDDDLPPLEANTNRHRPFELYTDSDSGSDS